MCLIKDTVRNITKIDLNFIISTFWLLLLRLSTNLGHFDSLCLNAGLLVAWFTLYSLFASVSIFLKVCHKLLFQPQLFFIPLDLLHQLKLPLIFFLQQNNVFSQHLLNLFISEGELFYLIGQMLVLLFTQLHGFNELAYF